MYTFLISSAIETTRGIFTAEQRLSQTFDTIASIKNKVPNARIVLYEVGATLSKENLNALAQDDSLTIVPLQSVPQVIELSSRNLISHGEAFTTQIILNNIGLFINENTKRIFKISGRYKLQDSFDIKEYENIDDKFVFKKHQKTWMNVYQQRHYNVDGLFDTRLYSFTPSLVNYYMNLLSNIFEDLNLGMDLEHAMYKNLDKSMVIEFDKIHCEGMIAPNGSLTID